MAQETMAQETMAQGPAIVTQSRSVCDVAEDIRAASATWRQALQDPDGAFELEDAAGALTAVRDAWADDFQVYREVLAHWCQAAQASAAGYASIDEYVAAQHQRTRRML